MSLLPEREGVCVSFPAFFCKCHQGAAPVDAALVKPDQTRALKRAKRMPESRAIQYEVVSELDERRRTLVAIDNLGEDGKLR